MNVLLKTELLARQIVRKIARTIVRMPAKWYFNQQFKQAFTDDYDTFWIVDIDNTIADSWKKLTPQYQTEFRSVSDKIMSVAPFEPMQALFKDIPPRTRVVFLTARQYIRYFVTKRWLKKHGFLQADSAIVLVERMKDKAPLLESVLKNYFEKKDPPQYFNDNLSLTNNPIIDTLIKAKSLNTHYPIIYFDDLSYNHENGEVLFYENVIHAVRKMPIRYIDYDELLIMQANK